MLKTAKIALNDKKNPCPSHPFLILFTNFAPDFNGKQQNTHYI